MLSGHKLLFISFIVLALLASITEGISIAMLVPILEGQSDNSVFNSIPLLKHVSSYFCGMDEVEKLQKTALILGAVLLIRGLLMYTVEYLNGYIPLLMQKTLFRETYKSLINAEFSYFSEKTAGDHSNSLIDWVERVSILLTSFISIIQNMILLGIYTVLMISLSWKMAIIACIFALFLFTILKTFTNNVFRKEGAKLSEKTAEVSHHIYETISGMKLIKSVAAEDIMYPRYTKKLDEKIATNQKLITYQSVITPFLTTFAGIFVCFLLFFGSQLNEGNGQWVSGLLIFLFVLMRLLSPISKISYSGAQITSHMFVFEQVDEFFKETSDRKQPTGPQSFKGITSGLSFKDVQFNYVESNNSIIKNVNLDIPAGKMVAIVGPSGAGKTTLVSLLMRFYDPRSGNILIDGTPLNDINIHELRKKISVVSQDIFIFNDTVSNNLSFSTEGVSQADIEQAAKMASAHDFIMELSEGYDTKLGDRGIRLSGGQQQRIAIARAILRNPDLIIFDEATSHLDTITEQSIQQSVEILRKDRTVLVIAHRLSTIQRADIVVVLKDGIIVEQGTHSELIALSGEYANMVAHQNLDLVYDDKES
ncbi:ABC transporter ATP-binding protein [Terasakiella sp. A23]|uniref:ABC transporter ATP-binding protein n=1 Tax=Terasakiella sp. FCG-A23 TaxID=3080561 RepID=UPI0029536F33|nr:ABC transporter ATP-binding protein [Terasakiella sp. A23]MDV7340805.1 ABC transporter ATP-binding protein [Terasakiella sp. A23]